MEASIPRQQFVFDRNARKISAYNSPAALDYLFPGWQQKGRKETVVFVGAHEDDALAGASMLISNLVGQEKVNVHLLVLTNGSQGYSPYKILMNYPAEYEFLQQRSGQFKDISLDRCIDFINEDEEFLSKVAEGLQPRVEHIRRNEMASAVNHLGLDYSNVHYFTHNDKTVDDRNMQPYRGAQLIDGQKGLDGWVSDMLRSLGATRVLGQVPYDRHPDHRIGAEIAYFAADSAAGNMLHRGKAAPIVNYDGNRRLKGLFYLIYEKLPQAETSSKEGGINRPGIGFIGDNVASAAKHNALKQFKTQRFLVELYDQMPGEAKFEYFMPMEQPAGPISPGLIDEKSWYHDLSGLDRNQLNLGI